MPPKPIFVSVFCYFLLLSIPKLIFGSLAVFRELFRRIYLLFLFNIKCWPFFNFWYWYMFWMLRFVFVPCLLCLNLHLLINVHVEMFLKELEYLPKCFLLWICLWLCEEPANNTTLKKVSQLKNHFLFILGFSLFTDWYSPCYVLVFCSLIMEEISNTSAVLLYLVVKWPIEFL